MARDRCSASLASMAMAELQREGEEKEMVAASARVRRSGEP